MSRTRYLSVTVSSDRELPDILNHTNCGIRRSSSEYESTMRRIGLDSDFLVVV